MTSRLESMFKEKEKGDGAEGHWADVEDDLELEHNENDNDNEDEEGDNNDNNQGSGNVVKCCHCIECSKSRLGMIRNNCCCVLFGCILIGFGILWMLSSLIESNNSNGTGSSLNGSNNNNDTAITSTKTTIDHVSILFDSNYNYLTKVNNYTFFELFVYEWLIFIGILIITRVFSNLLSYLAIKIILVSLRSAYDVLGSFTVSVETWKIVFYFVPLMKPFARLIFVILSFILFVIMIKLCHNDDYDDALTLSSDNDNSTFVGVIYKIYSLSIIFTLFLFFKSIMIRLIFAKIYLKQYLIDYGKILSFNEMLKTMLNRDQIFSPRLAKFLVTFPNYYNNRNSNSSLVAQQIYSQTKVKHLNALCLIATQFPELIAFENLEKQIHMFKNQPKENLMLIKQESSKLLVGLPCGNDDNNKNDDDDLSMDKTPDTVNNDENDKNNGGTGDTSVVSHELTLQSAHRASLRLDRTMNAVPNEISVSPNNQLDTGNDNANGAANGATNVATNGIASKAKMNIRVPPELLVFNPNKRPALKPIGIHGHKKGGNSIFNTSDTLMVGKILQELSEMQVKKLTNIKDSKWFESQHWSIYKVLDKRIQLNEDFGFSQLADSPFLNQCKNINDKYSSYGNNMVKKLEILSNLFGKEEIKVDPHNVLAIGNENEANDFNSTTSNKDSTKDSTKDSQKESNKDDKHGTHRNSMNKFGQFFDEKIIRIGKRGQKRKKHESNNEEINKIKKKWPRLSDLGCIHPYRENSFKYHDFEELGLFDNLHVTLWMTDDKNNINFNNDNNDQSGKNGFLSSNTAVTVQIDDKTLIRVSDILAQAMFRTIKLESYQFNLNKIKKQFRKDFRQSNREMTDKNNNNNNNNNDNESKNDEKQDSNIITVYYNDSNDEMKNKNGTGVEMEIVTESKQNRFHTKRKSKIQSIQSQSEINPRKLFKNYKKDVSNLEYNFFETNYLTQNHFTESILYKMTQNGGHMISHTDGDEKGEKHGLSKSKTKKRKASDIEIAPTPKNVYMGDGGETIFELSKKSKKYEKVKNQSKEYFKYFDRNNGNNNNDSISFDTKGKIADKNISNQIYYFLKKIVNLRNQFDSLQDILNTFDAIVTLIMAIILLFIMLIMFNFDFQTAVSLYASLLAIFVIFGRDFLGNIFAGITLIFGISPFNVGDVITYFGTRYVIKKINLLSCEMLTLGSTVFISNSELLSNMSKLINFSRSQTPVHLIDFWLNQYIKNETIATIKTELEHYINQNMQSEIIDIWFVCKEIDKEGNSLIGMFITGCIPFSQGEARWKQHSHIHYALREILEQLNIKYKFPNLPINENFNHYINNDNVDHDNNGN